MNEFVKETFDADLYLENIEYDIYNEEVDDALDKDSDYLLESFFNDITTKNPDILLESTSNEEVDAVIEGANMEMLKTHINAYKEFFTLIKIAKNKIKEKKYSEASEYVNKAKAVVNDSIEAVKKIDSDGLSAVIALLTGGIPRMARSLAMLGTAIVSGIGIGVVITPVTKMLTNASLKSIYSEIEMSILGIKQLTTKDALASSIGGSTIASMQIAAWVNNIVVILEDVIGIVNNIKNKAKDDFKDLSPDDFNTYKIQTINALKDLVKTCDKLNKKISEKAKMDEAVMKAKEEAKREKNKDSEDVKKEATKDFINACIEFAINYDEDDTEVITEGFNIDLGKEHANTIKEIRKALSEVKKNINKKDYESAKKSLEYVDSKIDEQINYLKKYEGGVSEAVCGHMYFAFVSFVKIFVATAITIPIAGIGGVIAMLESIYNAVYGTFKKLYDKFKGTEEITPDDFNLFKNFILGKYHSFKGTIRGLKAKIEMLEKKEKEEKSKEVKGEAKDKLKEEKVKLYEACQNGEITEDEREDLLSKLSLSIKVEESVKINDVNDDYSRKDGFDIVKKDIYERCANGEFDIDTREELISEAYKRFFEGDDSIEKIVDSVKKNNSNKQDGDKLINDVNKVASEA